MSRIEVEFEDVRSLLDIATQSMDWGSGFLDNDEVAVLRRIAEQIGSDPMEATPYAWRAQYPHAFAVTDRQRWHAGNSVHPSAMIPAGGCQHCPLPEADPIHVAA